MRGHRRVLAVGLTAALAAAACGGDDGGGGSDAGGETAATVDAGVKAGVAEALGGSSTTAGGDSTATTAATKARPTTMEEWEALWEEERAAIVARIKDEGWGKSADGNTLTGPEGFTIDLSACAAGWSDTEGLTDTEIKVGQAIALSGPAADYGNIARTLETLFAHYSEEGFFTDSEGKTRSIKLIYKDDGYDAAHHPARRRADRLREGVRGVDARLAERPQGLRQAEPAVHPPPARDERPPGLG
ncbi:MAG: hypothetical protein AB7W59_01045 [Acidimicrobiia bacterium]